MNIDIRENPSAGRIILKVEQYTVYLIHVAFLIVVLNTELVAVSLTDGTGLISPGIPDVSA